MLVGLGLYFLHAVGRKRVANLLIKNGDYFTAMLQVWLLHYPNLEGQLESLIGPVVGRADLADELEKIIETKNIVENVRQSN